MLHNKSKTRSRGRGRGRGKGKAKAADDTGNYCRVETNLDAVYCLKRSKFSAVDGLVVVLARQDRFSDSSIQLVQC